MTTQGGQSEQAAIEVGRRFLASCMSAWSAGEPAHRVELMMACADEFQAALDALETTSTAPQGDVDAALHSETEQLVTAFASALRAKLAAAEVKYGYRDGWRTNDWKAECQQKLASHLTKGDPLDVAAYAAFCWSRGWRTQPEAVQGGSEETSIARLIYAQFPDAYAGSFSGSTTQSFDDARARGLPNVKRAIGIATELASHAPSWTAPVGNPIFD